MGYLTTGDLVYPKMYPRISLATRGPPRPAPASGGARRTLRRRRQVLEFPEQLWTSADAGSDSRRRSESHLKLLFLLIKQKMAERVELRLAFLGRRPSGAGAMRRSTALLRGCRTRSIRDTWVRIPISHRKCPQDLRQMGILGTFGGEGGITRPILGLAPSGPRFRRVQPRSCAVVEPACLMHVGSNPPHIRRKRPQGPRGTEILGPFWRRG